MVGKFVASRLISFESLDSIPNLTTAEYVEISGSAQFLASFADFPQDNSRFGNFRVSMKNTGAEATSSKTIASVDWAAELDRHARWLRTVIMTRSGEAQAVEEIYQEVAAAACAQKAPIRDTDKVAPWLYQLAVRQSLMYRRKMGRRKKLEQNYAERNLPDIAERQPIDPLGWLLAAERRTLIRKAMQQLNPRDAEMLMLKYTENWSYSQIAEHLGITHAAVESRLHRARQRLRRELANLNVIEANR